MLQHRPLALPPAAYGGTQPLGESQSPVPPMLLGQAHRDLADRQQPCSKYATESSSNHPQTPHEHRRITCVTHTANSGVYVRCGCRQSMPSSSIDNCARVNETVPSLACGQMNRPRSSLFANRHSPSPSNQSSLMMSPRRPRKTKTWPE